MSEMYIWAHTGPETALVKTRYKFTFLEEFPFYNTIEYTVKNVSQWGPNKKTGPHWYSLYGHEKIFCCTEGKKFRFEKTFFNFHFYMNFKTWKNWCLKCMWTKRWNSRFLFLFQKTQRPSDWSIPVSFSSSNNGYLRKTGEKKLLLLHAEPELLKVWEDLVPEHHIYHLVLFKSSGLNCNVALSECALGRAAAIIKREICSGKNASGGNFCFIF